MPRKTDTFYWLQKVWLFVVASSLIQATTKHLVVTKCLSCLPTVNHKFSITHSASNWTSSAKDAYGTEQLYMSCCMHWDFTTNRVQQRETTMWQLTGRTSHQVMSRVFTHNKHNKDTTVCCPQITHKDIIHVFTPTAVTIMNNRNGCSS